MVKRLILITVEVFFWTVVIGTSALLLLVWING